MGGSSTFLPIDRSRSEVDVLILPLAALPYRLHAFLGDLVVVRPAIKLAFLNEAFVNEGIQIGVEGLC